VNRKALSYGYIALLALGLLIVNLLLKLSNQSHHDDILRVVFLCVAGALLNVPQVRIEQGRLSLVGIANQAASMILAPLDASLVGIASSVTTLRGGAFPLLANAVFSACFNLVGALVATTFASNGAVPFYARFLVVGASSVTNLILVVIAFRVTLGEPLRSISTRTWTTSFYVAFAYSGLAAIVVSYVLDGSMLGYGLASIVCVLALALTDTIAGRRIRRVLEFELSDADRHLFHSRAVEGVVHNLRNHLATTVGYLKEIDPRRLDPVDRQAIDTAMSAASDAVTVLKSLAEGATPRVTFATEPVDLNDFAMRTLDMSRPRARSKEIELAVRESPEEVRVKADPLLLREVLTNLLNNAIDAAPEHGRVVLTIGKRGNGWPYLSVSDNGSGVSDDNRHHLFEPHYTTKETGTGLGLFVSYGIVREHQGDIQYSGSSRGAVFTVILPPFNR
jgi:signal transduction histidine kinase